MLASTGTYTQVSSLHILLPNIVFVLMHIISVRYHARKHEIIDISQDEQGGTNK